jgi:hypothetical protein
MKASMRLIRHRVNTLEELRALAPGLGAEIDLRSRGSELILRHDPFGEGERLSDFAAAWSSRGTTGTLILNPKEDGLERAAAEILHRNAIEDYFFLDLTVPAGVRLAFRESFTRHAVRVSEFESPDSALRFSGRAEWVWVDCFSGEPPEPTVLARLREHFHICLVSPELHGFASENIARFRRLGENVDAVCTKHPGLWQ